MSRQPIVSDWRGAAFAGVDFSKFVTAWEDSRDRAGTTHKYNKRDGGEGEDMGREPFRCTVHLAFIGPTWRADFLQLQATLDSTPIGTLTHPVYGAITARHTRGSGRMDVENAPNFYEVTVLFEESQVDTNASSNAPASQQGPSAKQQIVSSAVTNLAQYAPLFATAASAITALTSAATTYAAAAVASATSATLDATLPQQLASVLSLTNAAIAAIVADPAASPGFSDPAVAACEVLYDACAQVDDAARALRPTLTVYVVPMTMHITALSMLFYGAADGPRREAEILANNAGVLYDPAMIPAGTQLLMAPATV
jgi:hypothetical protein